MKGDSAPRTREALARSLGLPRPGTSEFRRERQQAIEDAEERARTAGLAPGLRFETVFDILASFPREARSRFIDRRAHLATLARAWDSQQPALILAYGRRRVGKSALLGRFVSRRRVGYFVAARQLKRNQLDDLGAVLGRISAGFRPGRPPRVALADWDDALGLLADAATRQRVGLVLDEFPYLVDADPALPSLIQRWWDRVGSRSNLMLVLAGSHQGMMRNLVAYDGALHGRPTATIALEPLDYFQAARFVPAWSAEDRIRAYAIAGGVPAYLELLDDQQPFRDELLRLAYRADGRLFIEAPSLLQTEFSEPRTYESILRSIAAGETQPSRIAQRAGLSGANVVGPYLDRLIALGLVERRTLPPEHGEVRPRTSQYVIADQYLRFYFALVDPYRSDIQLGNGAAVLDHLWPDRFDEHVIRTFEDVARQYLWLEPRDGQTPVTYVGPWWLPAADIDAVATSRGRLLAAAEARWSRTYVKPADLDELRRNVDQASPGARPRLLLFSRSGFDDNLRGQTDAELVSLRGLFSPALDADRRATTARREPERTVARR